MFAPYPQAQSIACFAFVVAAMWAAWMGVVWGRSVNKWTFGRAAQAGGIAAYAFIVTPIMVYLSWPASAQAPTPTAPQINNNSGCINIGPSQGSQTNNCPTIINPPVPHSPTKFYLLNGGREIGDAVGIHVSDDQKKVTFDQMIVPDDFPWGSAIQLQQARVLCNRPSQGAVGRIEGNGPPVNKYWSITCSVLGPA
jgi:hypothetical protein